MAQASAAAASSSKQRRRRQHHGGNNSGGDVSSVYSAVARGETAARVREIIEQFAKAKQLRRLYNMRRLVAVNYKSSGANNGETPLGAAHRLGRRDLVGALLENGADAKALGLKCNALALALHHGQTKTLRVLLRRGWHKPNEALSYNCPVEVHAGCSWAGTCSPVHLAVVPPLQSYGSGTPPPRIDALELLVEFGADVNSRDTLGQTPLHWAGRATPGHRERAADALVSAFGADVNAADSCGWTPIFYAARRDPSLAFRLLSLGASADVLDKSGWSPLMYACHSSETIARATVPALLRASSRETRRAVNRLGRSAIDYLIEHHYSQEDWCQVVISQLLSSGTPVQPSNASRVLPLAARRGARLESRVAARESKLPPWKKHEMMVKMAFDFQEVREAEEGVKVRERRVRELEEELRALGVGTEDTDESDESGEEEGSGEEGGESGGSSG